MRIVEYSLARQLCELGFRLRLERETSFSNGCIWRLINVRYRIDPAHTFSLDRIDPRREFSRVHARIVMVRPIPDIVALTI